MKYIDIVLSDDDQLIEKLRALKFSDIFILENNIIKRVKDAKSFELNVYDKSDIEEAIRKSKVKSFILSQYSIILDKGLCKRLKEAGAFVIADIKSLIKKENFFDLYRNFLINIKRCNDFGVNCLFVTLAENKDEVKSPIQLLSFAKNFGYSDQNFGKSNENLIKYL